MILPAIAQGKLPARALSKIAFPDDADGCWVWTAGARNRDYGVFQAASRKAAFAHNWVYRQLVGDVPDGLELDHLCRNHRCVNPNHREPVTHRVNVLRGVSPAAENAKKLYGDCGHPLFGDNLLQYKDGRRECLTCHRAHGREWANKHRVLRGYFDGRRRSYCPHGHELTDDNLDRYMLSKGYRACKTCKRERGRRQPS